MEPALEAVGPEGRAGDPGAVIRGRGKDNKSRGVTVKKTTTAMVIGIYDEGVQPADCNQVCPPHPCPQPSACSVPPCALPVYLSPRAQASLPVFGRSLEPCTLKVSSD